MRRLAPALALALLLAAPGRAAADPAPLSPDLAAALKTKGPTDTVAVIVTMADTADVAALHAAAIQTRGPGWKKPLRGKVVAALKERADRSLPSVEDAARRRGASQLVRLWAINGLAMTVPASAVADLAVLPGVAGVRLDGTLKAPPVTYALAPADGWNLETIHASAVWNLGHKGAGVVVGLMDTGADLFHPDLKDRWRGGDNSWFDAYGRHATPRDLNGHGTHVAGLAVGGSASGSPVGMAPEAKWIAARIFDDSGTATYSAIHQAFQWLLDPDGNQATADAPDVVNGSWGLDAPGLCLTEFQADVMLLKAAEITPVFAAGNKGSNPDTSVSPANYPGMLAVAAADADGTVAGFSSRGPSACGGGLFPALAAPGVQVRAPDLSYGGTIVSYAYVDGTSFAAPHVAGALALLVGAFPDVPVSQLEQALAVSTLDLAAPGDDGDSGRGLVDALAAFRLAETIPPDRDGDGYADALDCRPGDPASHPGAIEIKHDGIDQDCNGYDLTIDILTASYIAKRDRLAVEATSRLGSMAKLQVVGYGPMTWNAKQKKWTLSLSGAGGRPAQVTVTGIEGSETATPTS
ncbi:MAG TPA: S8 family serine peptidase [Azospirillaceae bacterium]|nr:S8 family serine peptidase [Azospirillaceae bacterium]